MKINSHIFFFLGMGLTALAGASYDEGVSGDLSGSFASPTAITIEATNILTGTVGANGNTGATDGTDADYFSFSLNPSQTLEAINVISSTGDNVSFFGYTAGLGFTGQGSGDIDGFVLFGASSGDVISSLVGGPVTGGDHSFWIQETTAVTQSYSLEFVITEVPLPAAVWMFAAALGVFPFAKRSKGLQAS